MNYAQVLKVDTARVRVVTVAPPPPAVTVMAEAVVADTALVRHRKVRLVSLQEEGVPD